MKQTTKKFLGKGRSAEVFRLTISRKAVARKIFTGSAAADFVMSFFFGTPVDYQWNEAAVKTAYYRRKVLAFLLKAHFGKSLRIAEALGYGHDQDFNAYYLDAEFCKGELPALYTPFSNTHIGEYQELNDGILPELQSMLLETGFTGTVWQAGYGQPCAVANFLCESFSDTAGESRWVWIDAESGVPAVASHNPVKQLTFYIPQMLRRGRPLFDDIDQEVLFQYLENNSEFLEDKLGSAGLNNLRSDAEELISAYRLWRKETRLSRVVKYLCFQRKIPSDYAEALLAGKASRIMFMLTVYFPLLCTKILSASARKVVKLVKAFSPTRWCIFFLMSGVSRKYRIEKSRGFVIRRIREWKKLGRITSKEAGVLEKELYIRESSQYLADFGVFLALKPFGYFVKLCILPVLLLYGLISPQTAVFIIAFFSISLRFTYAVIRAVEDLLRGRGFPYIALLVAPVPSFGTMAYPCQMVHTARKGHEASRFIVYEVCSTIAAKFPIWGGYNSELEYFLNRLAYKVIKASE